MKENAQSLACQLQALHCLQSLTESHGLLSVTHNSINSSSNLPSLLPPSLSPLPLSLLFLHTLLQTTLWMMRVTGSCSGPCLTFSPPAKCRTSAVECWATCPSQVSTSHPTLLQAPSSSIHSVPLPSSSL